MHPQNHQWTTQKAKCLAVDFSKLGGDQVCRILGWVIDQQDGLRQSSSEKNKKDCRWDVTRVLVLIIVVNGVHRAIPYGSACCTRIWHCR